MSKLIYQKRYRSGLSTGKLFALAGVVFTSAIAVSATSTFAWYSISEKFRIVGFDMSVSHEENEWFKLGKKEADGSITYQEDEPFSLKEDLGVVNPVVGNVSNMSVDSYPTTYDEAFKPTFSSGYRVGGTTRVTELAKDPTENPDEAEYVQFELYAWVKTDAFLYLTPNTAAIANEEANRITAATKGVDVRELNNVVNAARISFYTPMGYQIVELGEHEEVYYSGLLDLTGDGYFDADADGNEILYGSYSSNPNHETQPLDADEDPYDTHDIFHAAHKKGVYKWDGSTLTQDKKEDANDVSYYSFDLEDDMNAYKDHHPIGALKGGEVNRIVVSVFLEGWDHDMTSSLIDSSFNLNLGFVAEFNPDSSNYLP